MTRIRAEFLPVPVVSEDDELDREFASRVSECSTLAFRVAFSVLRHREDAEDVAQDAFVRAHRSFHKLRNRDLDSMNDLDRELARALQVDPAVDFPARVRARLATAARPAWWRGPTLVLSAIGCAALAANLLLWRVELPMSGNAGVLLHRNLTVIVPLPALAQSESPQGPVPTPPAGAAAVDVMVFASKMLALQRLFSGATAAPPPAAPVTDQLSILELAIEPIPFPTIAEGDSK